MLEYHRQSETRAKTLSPSPSHPQKKVIPVIESEPPNAVTAREKIIPFWRPKESAKGPNAAFPKKFAAKYTEFAACSWLHPPHLFSFIISPGERACGDSNSEYRSALVCARARAQWVHAGMYASRRDIQSLLSTTCSSSV